jgi:hypothetical protein
LRSEGAKAQRGETIVILPHAAWFCDMPAESGMREAVGRWMALQAVLRSFLLPAFLRRRQGVFGFYFILFFLTALFRLCNKFIINGSEIFTGIIN